LENEGDVCYQYYAWQLHVTENNVIFMGDERYMEKTYNRFLWAMNNVISMGDERYMSLKTMLHVTQINL